MKKRYITSKLIAIRIESAADLTVVFARVCVIRKDSVPVGAQNKSNTAPDYYVYKHNSEFRDTLLQLIKSCQVASYKAKNFEDRITNNRKSFLQSVQKSAFGGFDK